MWLLAFFQAETVFGRLIKIGVCAVAVAGIYVGLVWAPQPDIEVAVSLAALATLWVHGYRAAGRLSHTSAQCVAEIREDERRIRVVGGGVDFVLRLASRTLNVNRVAKQFISNDAPGEFQRLRSGSFDWPFLAMTIDHEPRAASATVTSIESASQMRWTTDEATVPSAAGTAAGTAAGPAIADAVPAGEREIAVYWTHPGHGDRLLFSTIGPAAKYEAIERAFSTFTAWIDEEDEARRAIERRQEVEAWQREWEAKRLAEEVGQARRKGDGNADDTPAHMLAAASIVTPSPSRRW
jgi:hypothetical protein